VRDHEPELALNGGCDGRDAIRAIANGAKTALSSGGWLVLEHHHDQSEAVVELLHRSGLNNAAAHFDLEGVKRFVCAQRTT
jgi:release factor glutamine methyltransferase